MKNHRMLALAGLAILLFGAVGFTGSRALAQGSQPPATAEVQSPSGTQDQSGDQIEDNIPDSSDEQPGVEAPESAADTGPDEQSPSYARSIAISPSQTDGLSESDEASALQSLATITSAQAEAAALNANPGTSVIKAELDNENGTLVYSVELSNGSDVKVDAGTGQILHTDQGGDNEG